MRTCLYRLFCAARGHGGVEAVFTKPMLLTLRCKRCRSRRYLSALKYGQPVALDAETLAAAASRTASHGGFFVEISDRAVTRMGAAGLPWMASGFFSSAR